MSLIIEFLQSFRNWQWLVVVTVTTVMSLLYRHFYKTAPKSKDSTAVITDENEENDLFSGENNDEENEFAQIPLNFQRKTPAEMLHDSSQFLSEMRHRRSVRSFSDEDVPLAVIKNLIATAGTAPSGSNLQPWTFAILRDNRLKREIREIIETEEEINYTRRMGDSWVKDVSRLKVNWQKPYLEQAPYVLVVLKHAYGWKANGERQQMYYNEISTSIAVGFLLTAIQKAGLVSVTTTPLNAGVQIRQLLNRPSNEKVLVLLPIGYPAEDATIPDIDKKPLDDILALY